MRHLLLHLVLSAAGLAAVDYFLAELCFVRGAAEVCPAGLSGGVAAFVVGGVLLGVLNTLLRPLLKILALPITLLTAGLFTFVINAIILAVLAWLLNHFQIAETHVLVLGTAWLTYLKAALLLAVFNFLAHALVRA